ncbi:MAG: hypothetical protein ACOVO1_05245 [Chitinophagaceae bacterium]
MRWLLFMNRIALICNICFAAMFAISDIKSLSDNSIVKTVLVLALCAFILNFITLLTSSIAYVINKRKGLSVPLFIINIAFFLVEYYYYFIMK